MRLHLYKIGRPIYVIGYQYSATYSSKRRGFQPDNPLHIKGIESVLVRGSNGTARFDGFCWGYGGEGPRGLRELLKYLGLNDRRAEEISWCPRSNSDGTDWHLSFQCGRLIYTQLAGLDKPTQKFNITVPAGFYCGELPYQKDAHQWYLSVSYSVAEDGHEWGSLDAAATHIARRSESGAGTGFGRRDLSFYYKNHTDALAAKTRFEQRAEFRVDQFNAVEEDDE